MSRDNDFLQAVLMEANRARKLFPQPDGLMTALVEEVGETAKAMLDEPWDSVRQECIQVAAMALRLAIDGDPTLDGVRAARVQEGKNLKTYGKPNGRI